jgi:hypothetical protein
MQKKDHSEKSLRARQRGIGRMSDQSKVLLTLDDGDIIVAKRFGYVDGGLMGIHAECDDGTFTLFAVKSNPTNAEFHEIEVPADASYEEKKKAVEDATGWESDDEFPWLDTDENGDAVPGMDTLERINNWLNAEIELEMLEYWGQREAGEYAPGFALMDALSDDEQLALGLREQDLGGPASSVPCVTTTATLEKLNEIIAANALPFIFVDDEGSEQL